jgi:hypothetical protein
MKKYFIGLTVAVLSLLALGWVGISIAFAQSPTPPAPNFPYGPGMRGSRGGFGPGIIRGNRGDGPLHEYMLPAIASAFGLNPDELESQINNGETMWQIAQSQGLTTDEFYSKMSQARTEAINKAVADGVITQDLADWMLQRIGQIWNSSIKSGFGPNGCQGNGAGFGIGSPWLSVTPSSP